MAEGIHGDSPQGLRHEDHRYLSLKKTLFLPKRLPISNLKKGFLVKAFHSYSSPPFPSPLIEIFKSLEGGSNQDSRISLILGEIKILKIRIDYVLEIYRPL